MHESAPASAIDRLLEREAEGVCRLLSALECEHRALAAKDLQALAAAVEQKRRCSAGLERLALERDAALAAAGYPAGLQGLQAWVRAHEDASAGGPGGVALRRRWEAFCELLERCYRANRINGAIVETGRRVVEQTLALLRGEEARCTLYDPGGDLRPAGVSQLLART